MSEETRSELDCLICQPFRISTSKYISRYQQHLSIHYRHNIVVLDSTISLRVLSNAVWNGGMQTAETFVNYRVPLHYESHDPISDMFHVYDQYGIERERTVGLMTAAKLSHAVIAEHEQEDYKIFVMVTSGTSNAARAGMPRQTFPAYHSGTINIFIMIDARLSESAMTNCMITVTEAKSAALADYGIREAANGLIATGTTTDAVVIAATQSEHFVHEHQYAGTATSIGCHLAELVYLSVSRAISTQYDD